MQLPIVLSVQPSPRVGAFYFLLHALALLGLYAAAISSLAAMAGAIGVVLSAARCAQTWRAGIGRLRLGERGQLEVSTFSETAWTRGRICQTLVWPWLVMIRIEVGDDRPVPRSIILLRGDIDAATWRRVAIWLRWSPPAETSA